MSLSSILSSVSGFFTKAKAVETAVLAELSVVDNFVGVALGMAEAVLAVADPALLPAIAALESLRSTVKAAVAQGAATADQIASLKDQAVQVAVLAAPALTVVANK